MRKRTRRKFPDWVRARKETALENLEKRLAMPDKEFRNTTKRFSKLPPNAQNKKELDNHRRWVKNQIEILKEKLKKRYD